MSGVSSRSVPAAKYIREIFLITQNMISKALRDIDGSTSYSCVTRIYHGWHDKTSPTPARTDFDRIKSDKNFEIDLSRRIGKVIFLPGFEFGDVLFGDNTGRILYNTNRSQGQKMIDTAIACDTLMMHRSGCIDYAIIISNDDDFIPVLVSCEAHGYQTILMRELGHDTLGVCAVNPKYLAYWGIK